MIQRISHTTIYVLDQDRALAFYTQKLGFEVETDVKMGTFRWLTVHTKSQPDVRLVLMPIAPSQMMSEEAAASLRKLVENGAFGGGVLETDDCKATYDELVAKGVTFVCEPGERPYGIEAVLKDDSGNWFSVVQRPKR